MQDKAKFAAHVIAWAEFILINEHSEPNFNAVLCRMRVFQQPARVSVLGSTGSIGVNTLDVMQRHTDRFQLYALSANSRVEKMAEQCRRYQPVYAAMADPAAGRQLADQLQQEGLPTRVLQGADALSELAADAAVDTVVCGIVGAAGLLSTLAAVDAGKRVLIANKEPLVMMGAEIMARARNSGAMILPVDSEHNAIFQCLPGHVTLDGGEASANIHQRCGIKRLLLTGSGGPFRELPLELFSQVTPQQAVAHPNWDMGPKISVDSATMMNKGLELIEACSLFGVAPQDVEIVVHPQSIIHSMVEYIDGSVLAQLGCADMRIPIANALAWPDRIESGADTLNLYEIGRFDFEKPDRQRFPAISLSEQAALRGGTLPTVMNAANEVAVDAFLQHKIYFDAIPRVVEAVMQRCDYDPDAGFDTVIAADQCARNLAVEQIGLVSAD